MDGNGNAARRADATASMENAHGGYRPVYKAKIAMTSLRRTYAKQQRLPSLQIGRSGEVSDRCRLVQGRTGRPTSMRQHSMTFSKMTTTYGPQGDCR